MSFDLLANLNIEIIIQLFLAVILGALLGLERERVGKAAGTRTFALVSLGSALFTILSQQLLVSYLNAFQTAGAFPIGLSIDPSRMIGQIVLGIGFLGAGVIIHHGYEVVGLTTAAELWVAAGIGTAVGLGFYGIAIVATLLDFLIIFVAGHWTKKTEYQSVENNHQSNP